METFFWLIATVAIVWAAYERGRRVGVEEVEALFRSPEEWLGDKLDPPPPPQREHD